MSGIAITFPSSSVEGQSYLAQNGFTYIYDSLKNRWKRGGDFVRAPKVLSFAGVAVTTTGSGITTGPNGALIYRVPGVLIPSSDVGVDSYKAYRYTDSYPNYTEIQVSISSAFSTIAYAATSTSTTFSIPANTLSGDQTYYLRARQFVGSNASAASTGEISGYSQNIVSFATTSVFLDAPTIVSIAGTTQFPVYQIGFAGTTLPTTVTYSGSGVGNLQKVEWRVTGPRNPDSTGDTALAEVGIGTFSSATLANALVLAMPFSGATGVGITNDVNGAIRTASGASAGTTKTITNSGVTTTAVGIATTTAHFYPIAAKFDGSTSYLTVSANSDFEFGTGDFTIEWYQYWESLASVSTNYHTLWSNNYTSGLLIQSGNGDGTYRVFVSSGTQTITEPTSPPIKIWLHYAVVRKGTIISIYRNGVLGASGTTSSSTAGSGVAVEIGRGNSSYYLYGNIQDLKVYKGLAKYQENFTPPLPTYGTISYTTNTIGPVGIATTAFNKSTGDIPTAEVAIGSSTAAQVASSLVLAMPMNRTFGFQDINVAVRGLTSGASAGTAKTVGLGTTSTANAPSHPVISSTESKWYDGAAYFNNSNYATIGDNADFDFGTGDFTLEGWFYYINNPTGYSNYFGTNFSNSNGFVFGILNGGNPGVYRTPTTYSSTGPNMPEQTWTHLAVVRNSGILKFYVNGIGDAGQSFTVTNSAGNVEIGRNPTFSAESYFGYLQDLKIYKGLAKYTSNFTPPQPICGFTTDLAIQTGFTTTSATGVALTSIVGLGSTSTLAFGADQTYAGITSITSSSGITTLPDPYAQNLVLALPLANITGVGNSFTNDRNTQIRTASITGAGVTAGTTKTITNSGIGTTTGFLRGYNNTASGFSRASGNSISVADNADLELGSSNFTIEWWTYLTNTTGQYEGIWSKPGNSDANGLLHHKETDGSLNFNAATGAGSNWNIGITFGNCTLYANRWVHFAVVREGPTIRGYADGILRGTDTDSGTIVDNANPLHLGKYTQFPGSITYGFDGYLQDFRIYKGLAKYTSNFTPPPPMFGDYTRSTPNKIVFTPGSDYVLEARNTATGGIVTSTYSASRQWGTKPQGGIYDPYAANLVLAIPGGAVGGATSTFDVTGQIRFETPTASYVNAGIVTYSNSLGIGTYGNKSVTNTGPVSISSTITKYYSRSMQFNGSNNITSNGGFSSLSTGGVYTVEFWVYQINANNDSAAVSFRTGNNCNELSILYSGQLWHIHCTSDSGTNQITQNIWQHVAVVRTGSTLLAYLNGVQTGNIVTSNPTLGNTITIGRHFGAQWSGYIQDLRVYNIAKYTSNFTPPNQIYLT